MTEKQTIKKQFIAGAKCPECNQIDVLVFYRKDEKPVRECIDCTFIEILGEEDKLENKLQIKIKSI